VSKSTADLLNRLNTDKAFLAALNDQSRRAEVEAQLQAEYGLGFADLPSLPGFVVKLSEDQLDAVSGGTQRNEYSYKIKEIIRGDDDSFYIIL